MVGFAHQHLIPAFWGAQEALVQPCCHQPFKIFNRLKFAMAGPHTGQFSCLGTCVQGQFERSVQQPAMSSHHIFQIDVNLDAAPVPPQCPKRAWI